MTPGATVYVVWATAVATGSVARNLGALRVDADLNGALETLTPLQSFDLSITAEATAVGVAPTSEPVLRVRITPR